MATLAAHGMTGTARRALSPVMVFLFVAVVARMATFGNPLVQVDEQYYLVVARAMLHGQLVYVDIWDRKPIGLFLLYLPAAALPAHLAVVAYQAMALAFVVATATLIRHIVMLAGWRNGATAAAIFYILWINVAEGQGGQSPVFYNLPMAAAALAVMRATRAGEQAAHRQKAGLIAMLLVGLAIQIKYTVAFEGITFGLLLCFAEWRAERSPRQIMMFGITLAALALAPTAIVALCYAALGHFPEFLYANFLSILNRSGAPIGTGRNALVLVLILAPGLLMALWPPAKNQRLSRAPEERDIQRFLYIWLAVAISAVALFGTYFEHYALPVMLPAACCAAQFLGARKQIGTAFLILIALAGQIAIQLTRGSVGTGAQLRSVAEAIGPGRGNLYVYSGPTALYLLTGRTSPSSRVFPAHIKQVSEAKAIGLSQSKELARIIATRPEWIAAKPAQDDESPAIRAQLDQAIARYYHPAGTYRVGRSPLALYHIDQ